jgi:hypothetical protein
MLPAIVMEDADEKELDFLLDAQNTKARPFGRAL